MTVPGAPHRLPGDPAAAGPLEVVEFTDPLCPWAWGSEPAFRLLRAALAGRARFRRVYGMLFDDGDDPAPDPAAETAWYARHVAEISATTGAPYAARLRRVAASSWPAARVAKAAELQGPAVATRVLRRLRETVFVTGDPADTPELALAAVCGVPGLDHGRLAADAASPEVLERLRADHAEARGPVPEVLSVDSDSPHPGAARETPDGALRYALPTLLLRTPAGRAVVPGWRPFAAYAEAVDRLCPGALRPPAPRPAAEALEVHRSLTEPERRVLATGAWPPPGAVEVATGNGPLWLHPQEAAARPDAGARLG
ncbi:DsbA family oxidoreductase [Actinacidiphila yeochonensis]|uniref:DsbA family oxidoreductase n=1 Tax=Actinacidiphila yeochonensis TaxID=89050 RepID=UPI00056540B8|nr:DsbA family protein [Actinacidiphila yeochonensis]